MDYALSHLSNHGLTCVRSTKTVPTRTRLVVIVSAVNIQTIDDPGLIIVIETILDLRLRECSANLFAHRCIALISERLIGVHMSSLSIASILDSLNCVNSTLVPILDFHAAEPTGFYPVVSVAVAGCDLEVYTTEYLTCVDNLDMHLHIIDIEEALLSDVGC